MLLNIFLAPEDIKVGQGFLKHTITWFVGVGPSRVLGKSVECPCVIIDSYVNSFLLTYESFCRIQVKQFCDKNGFSLSAGLVFTAGIFYDI